MGTQFMCQIRHKIIFTVLTFRVFFLKFFYLKEYIFVKRDFLKITITFLHVPWYCCNYIPHPSRPPYPFYCSDQYERSKKKTNLLFVVGVSRCYDHHQQFLFAIGLWWLTLKRNKSLTSFKNIVVCKYSSVNLQNLQPYYWRQLSPCARVTSLFSPQVLLAL